MTEPQILLDTNCCIYLIEQLSPNLRAKVEEVPPGAAVTSAIAFGEVCVGTDWANLEAASLVNDFFAVVSVLPFDEEAARAYGHLSFRRNSYDRLIAAHALSRDLTLITANTRDFADIPGLKVEDWTR